MMATGKGSLAVLVSTHAPFAVLSLPCPAAERSDRRALVGTWHPVGVKAPRAPRLHAEAENLGIGRRPLSPGGKIRRSEGPVPWGAHAPALGLRRP